MLITRADIQERGLRIGESVPADNVRDAINKAIRAAGQIFAPSLVKSLQTLAVPPVTLPAEWDLATLYTTGQTVAFLGTYYTAKQDSDGVLPTALDFWEIDKDRTLYLSFLKDWLCYVAYREFLTWHGTHIAAAGLMTASGLDTQPISDFQRKLLMDDLRGKETQARAAMDAFYSKNYTVSVGCGTSTTRRGGNAWAV